jgi:hypothetical protein
MSNETGAGAGLLHSLIPLEDFKAILGIDDREYLGERSKDGEHLEASMPENVKWLLEPYKRRTI